MFKTTRRLTMAGAAALAAGITGRRASAQDATVKIGVKPAGTVDDTTRCGVNGNILVFNPGGKITPLLWLPNVPGV